MFGNQGLVLLGISLDTRMQSEELKQFVQAHKILYPVVLDAEYGVAQQYGIRGTPTTFLIDHTSKVVGGAQGPRQWDSEVAKELIRHYLQ
jgi:peroxiredoxin